MERWAGGVAGWLVPLVSMGASVALSPAASADHDGSQHYSRDSESCVPGDTSNIVDPIGIVFYGTIGSAQLGHSLRTDSRLEAMNDPDHDWINTTSGPQWVGSGGLCTEMEREAGTPFQDVADGFPNPARYHIRLNQNRFQSGSQFLTVGTPHYDVDTDVCGDVVPPHVPPGSDTNPSGFDYARGHVKNDWVAAYGASKLGDVQNWRNTRRVEQCTGSLSNSTGRVYYLITD